MAGTHTLITGATSDIGQEIARSLAPGRQLVLSDLGTERLDAVQATCDGPERHLIWPLDLQQPGAIAEALNDLMNKDAILVEHFVHCAGVCEVLPIQNVDYAAVLRTFNVNLLSAVELLRLLARKRVNKGALRTVTLISSVASRLGARGFHIYAASKGALNALARSLAVEMAPTVRVNCVLPGGIDTEGTRRVFGGPETVQALAARVPLGAGNAQDVANAVEFLVSDRARWITGQELVVDGGQSIL